MAESILSSSDVVATLLHADSCMPAASDRLRFLIRIRPPRVAKVKSSLLPGWFTRDCFGPDLVYTSQGRQITVVEF